MMQRPFRFGVVAAQARSGEDWAETARRAEALGYATLLAPDALEFASLAPLIGLTAAAAATRAFTLWEHSAYTHAVLATTVEPCPLHLGATVMADMPPSCSPWTITTWAVARSWR